MSNSVQIYIPPLAVERIIAQWNFEGGGFVALVSFGKRPTVEMLDAIQHQIDLKRAEIASGVNEAVV